VNIQLKSTAGAVREVCKYIGKELGEKQFNLELADMAEFIRVTYGTRQFTTFGAHYDPELEAELDRIVALELFDPEDDDPPGPLGRCNHEGCKSADWRFIAISLEPNHAGKDPPKKPCRTP
jgi:hypothetical protein